jgi:hypothetical protein
MVSGFFEKGQGMPLTHEQLNQQRENPQHVYVELTPGSVKRHHRSPYYWEDAFHFDGKPVRFTKLAADRMAAGLHQIPCDSIEGLRIASRG